VLSSFFTNQGEIMKVIKNKNDGDNSISEERLDLASRVIEDILDDINSEQSSASVDVRSRLSDLLAMIKPM
jgi:hypothetical protein